MSPQVHDIDEPHILFIKEVIDHYERIFADVKEGEDEELGKQLVKLCVLGKPGKRGEQELSGDLVS